MILEPEFHVRRQEICVSGETIRLRITPNMKNGCLIKLPTKTQICKTENFNKGQGG